MNADMQLMIDYTTAVLEAVCRFLETPPVFYVFGLICFVLVCKAIKIIMWERR